MVGVPDAHPVFAQESASYYPGMAFSAPCGYVRSGGPSVSELYTEVPPFYKGTLVEIKNHSPTARRCTEKSRPLAGRCAGPVHRIEGRSHAFRSGGTGRPRYRNALSPLSRP